MTRQGHNHLPRRDDPRAELGLRPVINVSGTMTALGASIIVPEAIAAMARIAPEFTEMTDLQRKASAHIARLTGAEAGTVTACCSAGITMAVAACMTGADLGRIEQLPDTGGMKHEVPLQTGHMVSYGAPVTQAVRLAGARVVPVGEATAPVFISSKPPCRSKPPAPFMWPRIMWSTTARSRSMTSPRSVTPAAYPSWSTPPPNTIFAAFSTRAPISRSIAATNSWAGRPRASSPDERIWWPRPICRTLASAAA